MTSTASGDAPSSAGSDPDLRRRVQRCLDEVLTAHETTLRAVSPDLAPLADIARDLLHGGKRLRPAFCYWGWRGAGGPDCDEIVRAATALELFHAAALVHDDVMDRSDTRRGMPSVHERFARVHREQDWRGPADQFGQAAAILLGDLILSWSDELFVGSGLPDVALRRARHLFDVMRTQLMAGQYLDMLEQAMGGQSAERSRTVIRYKSAKYTIEHPLLLGGALGDASPALLATYSAYGLPLGEAFQLRDDVLGVFGDPATTGKPAGDDLREGKRTMLVAFALERAAPAQATALRRHLGDPALESRGVDEVREILVQTDALGRVESLVTELAEQASRALREAPVGTEARTALTLLAEAATVRSL